jgi:tripartite-type tricarboxylate transporter receptor subunit TctC
MLDAARDLSRRETWFTVTALKKELAMYGFAGRPPRAAPVGNGPALVPFFQLARHDSAAADPTPTFGRSGNGLFNQAIVGFGSNENSQREENVRFTPESGLRGCLMTKSSRRRFLHLTAGSVAAAGLPRAGRAEAFPTRAITLIVPFPPGGSTDPAARILAARMADKLGQPMVVENVGGAGGSIAVARLARAKPDGYTIDMGQWDTHVLNGAIRTLGYDLLTDFVPIGLATLNPLLLVARETFPADDLKATAAWMKAHPKELKFAVPSASAQLAAISLQNLAGAEVLLVPYRGAGPAITDLISGQVDVLSVQASGGMPQVRAGTIKALANLSPRRSAAVPDVPTSDESGLPGLYMSGWFGLFAPKGTPADLVAKLNAAMVASLADRDVREKLTGLGLDIATPEQQTPAAFAAFHKAEIEKWWPIIKAAGIKAE